MQKSLIINNVILLLKMRWIKVYQKNSAIGVKRLLFISFIGSMTILSGTLFAATSNSYQVKAKRLYSMAKYTTWSPKNNKKITLCVYQPNPFNGALKKQVKIKGKRIKNRKFKVIYIKNTAQIKHCQLLFLSKQIQAKQLASILAQAQQGILTVGESDKFFRLGGMINFINAKGRFQINHKAIKKAGLRISSQLAKLAK